jgi:hypothetical protein
MQIAAVIQAVSFFGFFAALRCLFVLFVGSDRADQGPVPSHAADCARGFPLLSGMTLAEQASHAVLSCLASRFQNCTPGELSKIEQTRGGIGLKASGSN